MSSPTDRLLGQQADQAADQHPQARPAMPRGAGILLPQPQEAGLFIVLRLKTGSGDKCYEFTGRVVHATTQQGGDWLVGCEFTAPLSADDLDALLL